MSSEYPDFFARFYDLIYHQQRDSVDHDFFLDAIRQTKGKVLEIGAGTGRLFADALKTGADIYGLDISHPMLQVLRSKIAPDQLFRISEQNVIDFSYDFPFGLIVAPFRVMMHLTEKADQLKALNNVCRHLAKKGRFIFDAFIPDLNQLLNGIHDLTDFHGTYAPGRQIRRTVTTDPDLIHQIINIRFRFDWDEAQGEKHAEWNTQLHYFFRYELEHLIERSDFKNYRIFGNYRGGELDQNSQEFVVVCDK